MGVILSRHNTPFLFFIFTILIWTMKCITNESQCTIFLLASQSHCLVIARVMQIEAILYSTKSEN